MAESDSGDEFDDVPDEFEGLDLSEVPGLGGPTDVVIAPDLSARNALPTGAGDARDDPRPRAPSSDYGFDEMNDSILEAADALEHNREVSRLERDDAPARSRFIPSPYFQDISNSVVGCSTGNQRQTTEHRKPAASGETRSHKRRRSNTGSPSRPDDEARLKTVLEGFEENFTCAICCDLFVAPHVGNACGHTWCGECGWNWVSQHKRQPTCPICRTPLNKKVPMIPNFVVESTVEKHIQAMGDQSDGAEWRPNGAKHREWILRKERWKRQVAVREAVAGAAKAAPAPPRPVVRMVQRGPLVQDDSFLIIVPEDMDDGDYQASSDIEEVAPGTRRRSARHRPDR